MLSVIITSLLLHLLDFSFFPLSDMSMINATFIQIAEKYYRKPGNNKQSTPIRLSIVTCVSAKMMKVSKRQMSWKIMQPFFIQLSLNLASLKTYWKRQPCLQIEQKIKTDNQSLNKKEKWMSLLFTKFKLNEKKSNEAASDKLFYIFCR